MSHLMFDSHQAPPFDSFTHLAPAALCIFHHHNLALSFNLPSADPPSFLHRSFTAVLVSPFSR